MLVYNLTARPAGNAAQLPREWRCAPFTVCAEVPQPAEEATLARIAQELRRFEAETDADYPDFVKPASKCYDSKTAVELYGRNPKQKEKVERAKERAKAQLGQGEGDGDDAARNSWRHGVKVNELVLEFLERARPLPTPSWHPSGIYCSAVQHIIFVLGGSA